MKFVLAPGFDNSFILLNLNAVECLNYAHECAYYLKLVSFRLFQGCVERVLLSLEYNFDSLLLTITTAVCYEVSCVFSRFLEQLRFYFDSTAMLPQDTESACR